MSTHLSTSGAPAAAGACRRARRTSVQTVAEGSDIGEPGDPVQLVARYTLMAPDGDRVELLLLARARTDRTLYALPLSPMAPRHRIRADRGR